MARWLEPESVEAPRALRDFVGGHPLVVKSLVRRGYRTVPAARAFLDPDAYTPAPPEAFPDMEKAVARLRRAIRAGELVGVWGDFDVDGQTATTLLVSTLRDLGAEVVYHIPERATESHGVRLPWLAEYLDQGVRLLLTCDTGIDAHEAVTYAVGRDVDVIITDHHELPPHLPEAYAILNPHVLAEDHALAALPGVGVAYKLAEALYREAGRADAVYSLLDLVGLGIVADVAVQKGDTRYLLQRGLAALRDTQRLGLQALMALAKVAPDAVDEEDIGFRLAPRLNALGRLSDANVIVEFLTTEDLGRARILASTLEALNERRKLYCDQVEAAAEAKLERDPALLDDPVLVLTGDAWPPGVIGIVANRLVERYHRPVVMLATPEGEPARGSARSIPACHITQAIATQADILAGYGGHAMAAGLAIDPDRIPEFRRGLARAVAAQVAQVDVTPTLQLHGHVTLGELSLALVVDLGRLAPFGPGNPPLVLAAHDLQITGKRPMGRDGRHLRVTVEDADSVVRTVVWWNWQGAPLPAERFDLAFTVRVNEFRGERDVQLIWEDAHVSEAPVDAVEPVAAPSLEVLETGSLTFDEARERAAALVQAYQDVAVWVEGPARRRLDGCTRDALSPAETLVIWAPPPGPEVLQVALHRVNPARVAPLGQPTPLDQPQAFLEYLTGLVKYVLRERDGQAGIPDLAGAMGHREIAVRLGLTWLEAKGYLRILDLGEMVTHLVRDAQLAPDPDRARQAMEALAVVLAETAAYRRYFMKSGEKLEKSAHNP